MPNENNVKKMDQVFKMVIPVLMLAITGLFAWVWNTNTELILLRHDIGDLNDAVKQVVSDTEADVRQDATLAKHWKIVSFHRDKINELRSKADLPLISWPDL